MDPMNQNQNPVATGSQMPPMPNGEEKKPIGPIAGAVIVILLLVAGALYFWGSQLSSTNEIPYIPSDESMMQDNSIMQGDTSVGLPPQSTSDEAAAIESDFNAMNLDQIDSANSAELNNI